MYLTMSKEICIFLLITILHSSVSLEIQDLGGEWTVKDAENEYTLRSLVPGGIYSDLMKNGILEDIFFGFNDVRTRWVSKKNWNYIRVFQVDASFLQSDNVNIVFDGVDTFSKILINDAEVGVTDNMFVRYIFNIKQYLKVGANRIEVQFQSPVNEAKRLFDIQSQNYTVVPLCVPNIYNGECHANHVRKMQASFSWDWGPAFPSVGIWKSVYLESYNFTTIRYITYSTKLNSVTNNWDVEIKTYFAENALNEITGSMELFLNGHSFRTPLSISRDEHGDFVYTSRISNSASNINLWWPNGYGEPTMYELKVVYTSPNKNIVTKTVRVGFRSVELVQDVIRSGRMFYFKINGVPIFAKGSNSIPIHILPELGQDESRIRFLLQSAKDVHMNMLRVWGGGSYEADIFYDLADEMGILIWQDFMFACSMYPTNKEYLRSVKEEVKHQVRRLQHHPSMVLWAGNNENEAALRQNWYGTIWNFKLYKDDYVKLYVDVIKEEVLKYDTSIPYLVSSPTNGIKSEEDGHVAMNPQSNYYGDVHFYNYITDSWKTKKYPINRFSSEYGYQALPSLNTWYTATNESNDLIYPSKFFSHRQHHPLGFTYIKTLIKLQLNLPEEGTKYFTNALVYYSQIIQANAQKIQTEYYRRWRSFINLKGQGYTMGALYWQLNDVWVAPTWAGIDFKNNWKMLHYFAKNFFAPIIITGDLVSKGILDVFVVSDLLETKQDAFAKISVYNWNSLTPVNVSIIKIDVVPSASIKISSLNLKNDLSVLENEACGTNPLSECFIHFSLMDSNNKLIAPENQYFPQPLKSSSLKKPNLKIISIVETSYPNQYNIEIETDAIALFVWLEVNDIRGRFSENGFLLTNSRKSVQFTAEQSTSLIKLEDAITMKNVMDYQ